MYRQVLVDSSRLLQKILWGFDPQEVSGYTVNTVTYGTTSDALLTIRCLHLLSLNHLHLNIVAKVISEDFYVDDLLMRGNN